MSLFSLGVWYKDLWMDLWISLNSVVYQLIEWLYEVFELVANVNLFSEKVFNDFTDRIYIIVGIAMLFIFAYNIVLMIINPDDKKSTGNTTKIVKETIIALVLIILLPTVFRYMTVFQNHILSSHIIESIILGNSERLIAFCQGMQSGAPVDSFVVPEPWDMPGYTDKVIMAAGAFTLGSSIELSADAPLREPYAAWLQGGLNFHSGKTGVLCAIQSMINKGVLKI